MKCAHVASLAGVEFVTREFFWSTNWDNIRILDTDKHYIFEADAVPDLLEASLCSLTQKAPQS